MGESGREMKPKRSLAAPGAGAGPASPPAWRAPACALLWVILAGCGTREAGPQTVRFWAMGREGEAVAALLLEFEREHPELRVEVQVVPWTSAHAKLLTAFAGGSLPDLFQLGNTWIPEFAEIGALEPLDAQVAASATVAAGDYFPGVWETNLVGGRLYGLPWYVDSRLLFYRRDLLAEAGFDQPPRTWDAWRRALAAIAARPGGSGHAILLPLNEFEPLLALALQQDEPVLREGGRYGNFDSAGFRRALAFYLELFERGFAPPLSSTQVANLWQEFDRGRFAFFISGPWNIGELKRRLQAERQHIWMTAPMPGPDGPGASTAGGSSLVLFHGSKRKAAAWRLVEYLSRPDIQRRFHALTGNLPPRRSTWADSALAGDGYARAFFDQLERARPTPKVPEWERIVTEMQHLAARAVAGELDLDEAVKEIDRRVDAILAKRRWVLDRAGSESRGDDQAAAPAHRDAETHAQAMRRRG